MSRIYKFLWYVVESFDLECMRMPLFVGGA